MYETYRSVGCAGLVTRHIPCALKSRTSVVAACLMSKVIVSDASWYLQVNKTTGEYKYFVGYTEYRILRHDQCNSSSSSTAY